MEERKVGVRHIFEMPVLPYYIYFRNGFMKNFFIKLFVFSALIAALDLCWIRFAPEKNHVPHIWIVLGFFVLMTALFHFLAIRASKGKPQGFIRYYMGSTALRLMLYIMLILIYRFYDKPTLIPFALGFMAHYFLFTLFEVPVLLGELKKS